MNRDVAEVPRWPAANLRILSRVVGNSTVLMTGRRLVTHDLGREVSRMVIDQGEYEKLTDVIIDPGLTDAERAERIRESSREPLPQFRTTSVRAFP